MSSCHFGAMCFLWVSLVVPQHFLVFPAGLQQSFLLSSPSYGSSARGWPGLSPSQGTGHSQLSSSMNSCPVHLLPGSGSSEPTWAHRRSPQNLSSEICHLQKEILKLRVMANLKKAEKWEWEEHVCCSLNLSLRGCREALAGFSNIILRSCLQILTIPARVNCKWVQCLQLWSQQQAQEPAGEPAMLFYGKSAGNSRAWDCNAVESIGWQVCTRKNKWPWNKIWFFVSSFIHFSSKLPTTFPVGLKCKI